MTNIISTDNPLSEQQKEMLAIVVDMMIPAEGEMPSAADPLIMTAIIEGMGDNAYLVVQALSKLNELSSEKYKRLFAQLDSGQRDEIITAFKSSHTELVQLIQYCTASQYYLDDRVVQALGMEARSPHPGGYNVEATDWSLLDVVRGREKIYRKTE
jgi:hypothetical protein